MFHWATGETLEKPWDANYTAVDKCDQCDKTKEGTMLHAEGATGRVCPVLFFCHDCYKPKEK